MVCEMAEDAITWLNNTLPKYRISKHLIPQMIITGTHLDYDKHCKFELGSYAQVVRETTQQTT